MANLPEKNITLVDKITSIPSNSNLFLNADGEFRQASVNDVIKSATVVSDTVNNAINDAMQDSIDSHFKQATGSPILLTDTADGTLIDFKGKGRSTQDGEPTPDSPIAIKSVAYGGYFDGELLQGYYGEKGDLVSNSTYICSKNFIPCNSGDTIKLKYATTMRIAQLVYYNENKEYISSSTVQNSVEELTDIAPSNAKYFMLNISESSSVVTPQTTKPISVTINGKYALIVKSKGKNLLENTATSQTVNGVTFTVNDDKSVTANGIATATAVFYLSTNLENGNYILSGCNNGSQSTYGIAVQTRVNNTTNIWDCSYNGDAKFEISDDKVFKYCFIQVNNGVTVNNVTFYPMIRPAGTDDTYEPYKETVTYIPLNEPIRSSLDGTVTDEVSLTEVNRRFAEVVFDGSDDELWSTYAPQESRPDGTYCYFVSVADNKKMEYNSSTCTHFNNKVSAWTIGDVGTFSDHNKNNYLYFVTDKSTFSEWKTWLQANPITVQYELAEPITEEIEPVDIVTYDNVTYLTASDNAEMEIEYPTTKVAGIASIGYSKGRKAEYEVELLKAQLLELQTAMVNSL